MKRASISEAKNNLSALIDQVMPRYGEQHQIAAARDAVRMCNAVGITGFLEAAMSEAALRAYKTLDDEGSLTARVGACIATETMIAPAHDGVGDEVIARRGTYRSQRLRPDCDALGSELGMAAVLGETAAKPRKP